MARTNIHFEDKRHELIIASCNLFLEKGYEDTTISDILRAANISKGALYHYFISKAEILDAVILYIIDFEYQKRKPIIESTQMDAIEKLLGLKAADNPVDDVVHEAINFANNNKQSILFYRAQELNYQSVIPEIQKILQQGVDESLFSIASLDIAAHVFFQVTHLTKAADPLSEQKRNEYIVFMQSLLGMSPKNAARLATILD